MSVDDLNIASLMRIAPIARRGVELLLVSILAILCGRLFWLVAAPADAVSDDQANRPFPVLLETDKGGQRVEADLTLLMRMNPFAAAANVEITPSAPQTNLNISLSGVFMSTGGRGGSAIIRTANGRNQSFGVGDTVLPGVIVDRVLADRVILQRNGAPEALMLSGREDGLRVIGDPEMQAGRAGSVVTSSITEGRVSNATELLSAVSYTAIDRDGGVYGLRMWPSGSSDVMMRAGFLPGDIVLTIDGQTPVAENFANLLSGLEGAGSVMVEVERNNSQQIIRLRLGE
ncbi:MAG: type II secretion system protein N [Henriciella sp.]